MDTEQPLPPQGETQPPTSPPRRWRVRSPRKAARLRTQSRRLEYLRRNPGYVTSSDREFANVRLYDTLVREFQTPAERTAEAREKGFGLVLEASMMRNPEPLNRVGEEGKGEEEEERLEKGLEDEGKEAEAQVRARLKMWTGTGAKATKRNGPDIDIDDDDDVDADTSYNPTDDDAAPLSSREAARRRWHVYVRDWFVRGGAEDDGFDYCAVDGDSDYDAEARADAEAAWFEAESPAWVNEDEGMDGEELGRLGGPGRPERLLMGQTGIQDY